MILSMRTARLLPQSIRANLALICLTAIAPVMAAILLSGIGRRDHERALVRDEALRLTQFFAEQQEKVASGIRLQLGEW